MKLSCKKCGMEIPAEDMNLENLVAKCRGCNSVFSFADQVSGREGDHRAREKMEPPPGITVDDWGGRLSIVRRWYSPRYLLFLFFCVIWDGFIVFWYFLAFREGAPLVMKIFPVLHVAAGLAVTYFTLAGFVNRTRIEVFLDELKIRHGPLPYPGNRTIPSHEIKQLFTREKISRSENRDDYSYQLFALLGGGKRIKLLQDIHRPEQALFIEQQIESHLGIKDRKVRGEM